MITTLLVDDESLIRAGLRFIIQSAPDLTVVAEVEDGDLGSRPSAGPDPTSS